MQYILVCIIIILHEREKSYADDRKADDETASKNGFIRQEGGNHTIFFNPITKKKTVVPRHAKDLGKGLEQQILKQAGLK